MTKPRLLQLCLSSSWGGLEMAAFELAQSYTARGIFLRTVCPSGSRLEEKLTTEKLPLLALRSRKYFDPSCILSLRKTFAEDETTTVILQQLKDIWHARPALIGYKNIRLTGFAHIFLSVTKNDLLHAWLYRRMNSLICLTDIQKDNFAKCLPLSRERIEVIPNGVDTQRFRPELRSDEVRRSLGATGDEPLIGVIGRLDELKGQVETVEAAAVLKNEGLRFKIALIGEDTLNQQGTRKKLETLIRVHQLEDCVLLAGFRKDIPAIVASLDILAMPSWAETFGRVLIEAMACRVPLVATAAGGVPDIVTDGVDGLLAPPRNSRALATAFRRLLTDAAFARRTAEAGYKKAQTVYDLVHVQARIDSVLLVGDSNP
jgi:glycosyltransferase involved in cell wall biosynthesis